MSTNPFKGFGAINVQPSYSAENKPKMTSLGKQYQDNIKGVWPNSNQSLLMMVSHLGGPYITQYTLDKDGTIIDRTANSATLTIAGVAGDAQFSNDGVYLAVAHAVSPYITIAKRNTLYYTQLSNPGTLPTGIGHSASWSSDGTYLAISHSTTPYITIYKRSDDTFTKLSNPGTLPAGTGWGTKFSPDGTYLAVANGGTPPLTIYKRSGDTFTKLTDPTTLPTNTCNGVDWSPDGTYLALAHNTSPFLTIYKRSGDTFTKLANTTTLPASTGNAVKFSPDGTILAVAHNTTPFCSLYQVNYGTDTLTYYSISGHGGNLPTATGNSLAFTKDSKVLFVGYSASPWIIQYGLNGLTTSISNYSYNDFQEPTNNPGGIGILNSP